MTENRSRKILNDQKEYGPNFQNHLLDQYKLYVEMADNVSNRRSVANEFFLTLNTFLISGLALSVTLNVPSNTTLYDVFFPLLASLAGLAFCWAWLSITQSYRTLNKVKFSIINEVEARLPAMLYQEEWERIKALKGKHRHRDLTEVERYVPLFFVMLYLIYLSSRLYPYLQAFLSHH